MTLTYRNYTSEDIDDIIHFWNENSGWETNLDQIEFNLRFCSSPCGMPIIMLAVDDDSSNILGICCFLPAYVSLKGVETTCFRPFGAVIKESFREKYGLTSLLMGNHPILKLYQTGTEIAKARKASLIYLIPDPRWQKLAKIMPFTTQRFPLWSFEITADNTVSNNFFYDVRDMTLTDSEIEGLWERSSKSFFCTIKKNAQYYRWKINFRHGLYKLKGVYEMNILVGVFTFHFKERQLIIGDLLTLDNNSKLLLTLRAACYAAQDEFARIRKDLNDLFKVSILATTLIEEKIKEIGFKKDNYYFTLAIQLLDKINFSKADVAPDQWQINAND